MSSCCICSEFVSTGSKVPWNEPIFESPNFVVLPSLGSLLEGWLLLFPRKHFISMGALSEHLVAEMDDLKADSVAVLGREYGEICIFEHGPALANQKIGCGVDHAHLHIVPLNFDLVNAATPFIPLETKWANATWAGCRTAFESGQDYLYIEQPVGSGHIATHCNFGSQVFRKAIAAHLGVPEQFSWRDYPRIEMIKRTIQTLRGSVDVSF